MQAEQAKMGRAESGRSTPQTTDALGLVVSDVWAD